MESPTKSSGTALPRFFTAVRAVVSSTIFFTLVCFAAAMALLMSQPPNLPADQTPQASRTDAIESDLTHPAGQPPLQIANGN